jgi:hypothetical protein
MTDTTPSISSDTLDRILADVIYRFLEDVEPQTIDVGHVTGNDEPEITFGTTAGVIDQRTVEVTLWDENAEGGPTEFGVFHLSIERVI